MRTCAWCPSTIAATARADSIYCSKRCRQAAHRFRNGYRPAPPSPGDRPLALAYADPPYPGKAGIYKDHPDYGGEVDHRELCARLVGEYPDGWALSTSAEALPTVLSFLPTERVRVASWHRGARPTRSSWPLNAWEPVIYCGGRQEVTDEPSTRVDALEYVARARTSDAKRVTGAKPAEFLWWLFDLLGAQPHDDLDDLYPGSGGVGRAWLILKHGRPMAGGAIRLFDADADPAATRSADRATALLEA